MTRRTSIIVLLGAVLVGIAAAPAQSLFSGEELWAVGNLWKRTQAEWDCEQIRYKDRLAEIEASSAPEKHKEFFRRKEAAQHRAESQRLAGKRHQVQNVLIDEASARASGGRSPTSERIDATLGTKIDDKAHRGIPGDLDAQGGVRTAEKIKQTLADMGLGDLHVVETPGTLQIEGDFQVTIHKSGLEPQVGDEFHRIKNEVDARNHEVYLSERMRDRNAGTQQAGTDYVEVQDHLKKAADGHLATDQRLVEEPDLMQTLAKGTNKTLDMGDVTDEELAAILKQRGIKDKPVDFRKKLAAVKEQRATIADPAEAGRIREASKDIFVVAERKSYARSKQEFDAKQAEVGKIQEDIKKVDAMADTPATAERRKVLKKSLQDRAKAIREELIDSRSKMQAAKAANDELRIAPKSAKGGDMAKAPGGADATKAPDSPDGTPKAVAADGPDGKPKTGADAPEGKFKSAAGKAGDVFGAVMTIGDIGNACRTLEEYQEGKATLGQVVRSVVDLTPAGGVVGAGEKIAHSGVDYAKARQGIKAANETNMEAYLTRWELNLRKAGLSPAQARKTVGDAVLGGDLDALEARAVQLRAAGKSVETPRLVVEDGVGPDGGAWYMWDNTKDMATGMADSAERGIEYIVTAPGRTVMALGERELAEATLDYNGQTAQADMKTRLFRSLLIAGVDSKSALDAVQNGGSALKAATAEARANLQVARDQAAKVETERLAMQGRLDACLRRIDGLRWMEVEIRSDPVSPIPIPKDAGADQGVDVVVSVESSLPDAIAAIAREIASITGQTPTVAAVYTLNLKNAKAVRPGQWKITLPAKPDAYPVTVAGRITISGLSGEFAAMGRIIERQIPGLIVVKQAAETISLPKEHYAFVDGDYEPIEATVTGAGADPSAYFYYWTVGERTRLTDSPRMMFTAELPAGDKAPPTVIGVALCDAATGCILAEAHADATVSPLRATMLLVEYGGHVWKTIACDEVKKFPRNRLGVPEIVKEIKAIKDAGWLEADCIQGEARDRDYVLYGRPNGPYIRYAQDTGLSIDETGQYRAGRKNGRWTQYGDGGTLLDGVTTYVDGKKDGVEFHYLDGKPHGKTTWKNDMKDGVREFYSSRAPGGIIEWYLYRNDKQEDFFRWEARSGAVYDEGSKSLRPVTTWTRVGYSGGHGFFERYDHNMNLISREN